MGSSCNGDVDEVKCEIGEMLSENDGCLSEWYIKKEKEVDDRKY